jgi:hypothetical protein
MQASNIKSATQVPNPQLFGLPADTSEFARRYDVYSLRRRNSVSFEVSDLASTGVSRSALRRRFLRDMTKESCCKLEWTAKPDVFTNLVPDFADELNFNYLRGRAAKPDTTPSLANTYLAVTKDDDGRIISYAAATITFWFLAPDLETDSTSNVWTWLAANKGKTLTLSAKLDLHEAYTLAERRGAGASSAAMGYLAEVFGAGVQDVIDKLSESLTRQGNTLELEFTLYSEWESKSGCLASGHLLEEMSNLIHDLGMVNDGQDLPFELPDSVDYDAGF